MNIRCEMKVEHLSVEGRGCRAYLSPVTGGGMTDLTATGTIIFTIRRPEKVQGLFALGETYLVEFTPAPEKKP